jgi:hypothetical protein
MNAFFQTEPFSRALIDVLDYVAHGGADLAECLHAAGMVREGDYESWHLAWAALAERVRRCAAHELAAGRRTTARRALLRAAHYYHVACRFCAPAEGDPRLRTTRRASDACFDTAMRLSVPAACQAVALAPAAGSGYLYCAVDSDSESRPRPTLLVLGAEGVTALDLYFLCVVAATRHGWHCLASATTSIGGAVDENAVRRAAVTLPSVDPARLAVLVSSPLPDGEDKGGHDNGGELGRFHQRLTRWLDDHQ